VGKKLNFDDPRSKLFFEYVRLLKELNPKYFLLENVRMNAMSRNVISEYLSVEPIEINSQLVSGQYRRRLYWTNIPNVTQPEDKNINFDKMIWRRPHGYFTEYTKFHKKSPCITTRVANDYKIVEENGERRKITVEECEGLQTLTPGFTSILSDGQRYKCIGNCWTVDVVAGILSNIKE
jgi:DNA (cytosine-5)-methyltransferase 3A